MTAEEFFNTQTITDANRSVIDIQLSKFTYWDLIKFADYYGKDQYNQALDEITSELKKWFENEALNTIIREAVNLRKTIPFS